MSILSTGGPETVSLLVDLVGFEVEVAGLREEGEVVVVSGLAMSTAGVVVAFDGVDVEAVADLDPEGDAEEISAASFRFLAANAAASSADDFDVDEAVFPETVDAGFEVRCCEVDTCSERDSSDVLSLRFIGVGVGTVSGGVSLTVCE